MKTLLEYSILLFPMIFELISDWNRIMRKHKEDNHEADIPVRVGMLLVVGLLCHLLFDKHFIQGVIYSGALFLLFDPILNLMCKKGLFHHGKNFFDRFWAYTPPHVEILLRLWFISIGIGFYYYWDLIVS